MAGSIKLCMKKVFSLWSNILVLWGEKKSMGGKSASYLVCQRPQAGESEQYLLPPDGGGGRLAPYLFQPRHGPGQSGVSSVGWREQGA